VPIGYFSRKLRGNSTRVHFGKYSKGASAWARDRPVFVSTCFERGWLVMHESGTFVKFTQAGADLLA
jgi:hypothetical protein